MLYKVASYFGIMERKEHGLSKAHIMFRTGFIAND